MSKDKNEGQLHKNFITQEIFKDKVYEKYFEVEKGDIVLDCGASIGPFGYSIIDKKPKRIIGVEPSQVEIPTLVSNMKHSNFTLAPYAISDQDGEKELCLHSAFRPVFPCGGRSVAVAVVCIPTCILLWWQTGGSGSSMHSNLHSYVVAGR